MDQQSNIHPRISDFLYDDKKYLIILQGSRGSGKTYFAYQLKKIKPRFEVCSIDDYYTENGEKFGKNLSDAYSYCKQKTKAFLTTGTSVIYNNTNLDYLQIEDLIKEAKDGGFCPVIFKFYTSWNEEMCVKIARYFHPITQSTCDKQTIIRDNGLLFMFKSKEKITTVGITSILPDIPNGFNQQHIENSADNCIYNIIFKKNDHIGTDIEKMKAEYIAKNWFVDPPKISEKMKKKMHNYNRAPKITPQAQDSADDMSRLTLPDSDPNFIAPIIKLEMTQKDSKIQDLEAQIQDLEEQLENMAIGTVSKDESKRRRQRFESQFTQSRRDNLGNHQQSANFNFNSNNFSNSSGNNNCANSNGFVSNGFVSNGFNSNNRQQWNNVSFNPNGMPVNNNFMDNDADYN
jgi:hypothetical protein